MVAMQLSLGRRFEEAIAESRTGLELDSSYNHLYMTLGWGLAKQGRLDDAIDAFTQGVNRAPGNPVAQSFLGWAWGLAGHRQEALSILGDLERQRNESYVGGFFLAQVSIGLGEHDQAISWLRQGIDERDGWMLYLNTFFVLDPLRSDPRFQALLQRMNFPAPPE